MPSTHHRIPATRLRLAITQTEYLAQVADRAISLGDPASLESIEYAFAITPVHVRLDATAEATPTEVAAVRALVLAALEITR